MNECQKRLKDCFKYIYNNIDYLTYEDKKELLLTLRYYIDNISFRKFEHNFKITN